MIGKEIVRFHCVYWPAFLLAAGLPLPKSIVAHGWLLFEESKMSKSRGNIVRSETILEMLGADASALLPVARDRLRIRMDRSRSTRWCSASIAIWRTGWEISPAGRWR